MKSPSDRFKVIQELHQQGYPISLLCKTLGASQSGYYESLKRKLSVTKQRREDLKNKVKTLFYRHRKRYGRIRIHRDLLAQGIKISEKMVGSIMRELALKALAKRTFRPKTTTSSAHINPVEDLAKGKVFTSPNQCLFGDITYVATKEGWLYLSGFIDAYSKMIKGYSIEESMPTSLVTGSLEKAMKRFPNLKGAIIHSDRGSQYTSHCYHEMLSQYGLRISMGQKGVCYDNAVIESFWSTLKTECFPSSGVFETKAEAKAAIFEYIESYYNTQRRHSSLNYLFPLAAELAA